MYQSSGSCISPALYDTCERILFSRLAALDTAHWMRYNECFILQMTASKVKEFSLKRVEKSH